MCFSRKRYLKVKGFSLVSFCFPILLLSPQWWPEQRDPSLAYCDSVFITLAYDPTHLAAFWTIRRKSAGRSGQLRL